VDDGESIRFHPYSYEEFIGLLRVLPPLTIGIGKDKEDAVRDLRERKEENAQKGRGR